jgi:tetratricopeptide (TPR) repeat protein
MGLSPGTPLHEINLNAVDWPCYCAVLGQILSVLAHAHARGVIHHDLKPGNVLVFREAAGDETTVRVQVIDFGIAGSISGHSSGQSYGPTELIGTASYLAPEAVRGFQLYRLSPSLDLYAVGVMAYELAHGARPFEGDSAREILRLHQVAEPPQRPYRRGFDGPDALDAFIRRMLAKRPRGRYHTASEALAALRRMAPPGAVEGRIDSPGLPGPRFAHEVAPGGPRANDAGALSPSVLMDLGGAADHFKLMNVRPPPFAGRDDEQTLIWEDLTTCIGDGRPRALLIQGAPGVGRRRLARHLGERVAEEGWALVAPVPFSLSGSDSVEGWRMALLSLLGFVGATRDALEPELRHELTWLGLAGRLDPAAVLDMLFPAQARRASGDAEHPENFDWVGTYVEVLSALARHHPLMIVLEDVGETDDEQGIEVLEALLRVGDCPLLVVLTADVPTDAGKGARDGGGSYRWAALERLDRFRRVSLEGLSPLATSRLLEGLLPLDPALRRAVVEAAGGLPLYAVELLRAWSREGALERAVKGFVLSGQRRLPGSLADLWNARLTTVAERFEHGVALVDLFVRAAVLGQPFTYATLREMVHCEGRDDLAGRVGEAWSTWHAEGLWQQIAPGKALCSHSSLENAALGRVGEALVRSLHRFGARARLRAPSSAQRTEVLAVARHYARAGLPSEAFPFYVRAAREAYRSGRPVAAIAHCAQATRMMTASGADVLDRRWAVLYKLMADSFLRLSRFDEAEQIARRLEQSAAHWDDDLHRATALRLLSVIARKRGQVDEAEPLILEAKRLFQELGVKLELGRTELELGRIWEDRRSSEELRRCYRSARRHFADVGDDGGVALSLLREALVLKDLGQVDVAIALLERAQEFFRKRGDRHGIAAVLRHRGRCELAAERPREALEKLDEARGAYRSIGDRAGIAQVALNTGKALHALGQPKQAEQAYHAALEEASAQALRRDTLFAQLYLAELKVETAPSMRCYESLAEVVDAVTRLGGARVEAVACTLQARCAAELGMWPTCDQLVCRAATLLYRHRLADVDTAHHLERIGRLAEQADERAISHTALKAGRGIWERLGRREHVARLRLLLDAL